MAIFVSEEAKLRITKDGKIYPHFVADTLLAKRLSGLTQIMHDLEHAKELMGLIETIDNSDIAYSLWMSAVVTYGKCFASASGRKNKLELRHVEDFNPKAVDYHKALIAQRNSYFAHAGENEYEVSNINIILAPVEDGKKVVWVNHSMAKKSSISPDEIKMFISLCEGLFDVVEKIGEDIHARVLKEYMEMDIDELYKKSQESNCIFTKAR